MTNVLIMTPYSTNMISSNNDKSVANKKLFKYTKGAGVKYNKTNRAFETPTIGTELFPMYIFISILEAR